MGPLVSEEQLDRVCGYLESGLSRRREGAGGRQEAATKGYFVEPTVLVKTNPEMKVVRRKSLAGRDGDSVR